MLDELAFDPLASFDSIKQEGHSSEPSKGKHILLRHDSVLSSDSLVKKH